MEGWLEVRMEVRRTARDLEFVLSIFSSRMSSMSFSLNDPQALPQWYCESQLHEPILSQFHGSAPSHGYGPLGTVEKH